MDRTERFRGRLMAGEQVVIDPIVGQLKTHPRNGGGVGEWTGFFEYPVEKRESLVEGNRYRLVLIDGRSGHVAIHVADHDPLERNLVKFHGTGTFRR